MKDALIKKIQDSITVNSKHIAIDERTFQPKVLCEISFDYAIETMQDSKCVMSELEMYTLIGKTIVDKISATDAQRSRAFTSPL